MGAYELGVNVVDFVFLWSLACWQLLVASDGALSLVFDTFQSVLLYLHVGHGFGWGASQFFLCAGGGGVRFIF